MGTKAHRWLFVFVMGSIAFALVACSPGVGGSHTVISTLSPAPSDPDNSQTEPNIILPQFYLIADGTPVEGQEGSYCWMDEPDEEGMGFAICVDKIWPPEFAELFELPAGEPLRLKLDEPFPDTLYLRLYADPLEGTIHTDRRDDVDSTEIVWQVDLAPGDYVLVALGAWEKYGDLSYAFAVTIS